MRLGQKFMMLAVAAMLVGSCTKERFVNDPGNLVPKTADQDQGLPSITVNGAKLHSEAYGHPDSTMVVFLHGGPGGDYRYLLNGKELANYGYRVVFYDQRGSGLSQRFPESSFTSLGTGAIDMMYDDLSAVITHYRTSSKQKVILVGYSWGGILAAGYAGKKPGAINGLVFCEPGGFKWDDITEYVSQSRSFSLWNESLNDAAYLDQFLAGKEDQHELLDYKLAMMSAKDPVTGEDKTKPGRFWRSGAVVNSALFRIGKKHEPDFSVGTAQFNKPVLFFYSEKNKAYPESWARKISGAFSVVDLVKVPGVGHDAMIADQAAWTQTTLPEMLTYFQSL